MKVASTMMQICLELTLELTIEGLFYSQTSVR